MWTKVLLCCLLTSVAPTQAQQSSCPDNSNPNPVYVELQNLINKCGPYQSRDPTLHDISYDMAVEFFKHIDLIEQMVFCFEYPGKCTHPGMNHLINIVEVQIVPGSPCNICPDHFQEIIDYATKQFKRRSELKHMWRRLTKILAGL